jgi:3-methyl-2-oxobutanoate hydroxymethyltransferase
MKKLTVSDLFKAKKSGKMYTEIFTDNVKEAIACAEAGVDILVCMKNDLTAMRAAVPNMFIIAANEVSQPDVVSPYDAVSSGYEIMNLGADAIYSGMSMPCIEAVSKEYIPVIGHVGYVPYRSTWYGGPRAVGKTGLEAKKVYEMARSYQDAGAIGVEIEIVPAKVTEEINRRLENLILISMGSGTGATVQYLFATDVLGTNTGHIPRHAKIFGNLHAEEAKLQALRVKAFKALKDEVDSGAYPAVEHTLTIKDEEFQNFLKGIN